MNPEQGLLLALQATQCAQGWCAPNPAVGAVVVHEGVVKGVGCHHGPGAAHAEVMATRGLPNHVLREGVLYVTLEPCCHHGRTPPCTQWILDHGMQHVVFAHRDPNPQVSGGGQAVLLSQGVSCTYVPVPAITDFYRAYDHWWRCGQPWVVMKGALNAQAVMAGYPEHERLIITTGCMSLRHTHGHRLISDALMTTSATLLADQPQMTVRWDDLTLSKPLIVLGGERCPDVPATRLAAAVHWCYAESHVQPHALDEAHQRGIITHACASHEGQLIFQDVLVRLGQQGFHRVWVEVGPRCAQALLMQGCVNELHWMLAMDHRSPGVTWSDLDTPWPGSWTGRWSYLGQSQWLWQGCRS